MKKSSANMFGSYEEYIVQIRVQDYWVDCFDSTFSYRDSANSRLKVLKEHNPESDFQLIKRTSHWEDILLHEDDQT